MVAKLKIEVKVSERRLTQLTSDFLTVQDSKISFDELTLPLSICYRSQVRLQLESVIWNTGSWRNCFWRTDDNNFMVEKTRNVQQKWLIAPQPSSDQTDNGLESCGRVWAEEPCGAFFLRSASNKSRKTWESKKERPWVLGFHDYIYIYICCWILDIHSWIVVGTCWS